MFVCIQSYSSLEIWVNMVEKLLSFAAKILPSFALASMLYLSYYNEKFKLLMRVRFIQRM